MTNDNSNADDTTRSERISEMRDQRAADAASPDGLSDDPLFDEGIVAGSAPSLDEATSTTPSLFPESNDGPSFGESVLVCTDCSVYYEHDEDWSYCPRCSEELQEVIGDV
jgi:rubrerythrin